MARAKAILSRCNKFILDEILHKVVFNYTLQNFTYHRTISSESDCDTLQQDLNNVMDWGENWLTNFNLHKCKSLSFGIQVNM